MTYEYSKAERRLYITTLILLAIITGFYIVCQDPVVPTCDPTMNPISGLVQYQCGYI